MLKIFMLSVVVLLLLVAWLWWAGRSMIYYPTREIFATPDRLGWKFDDVYLTTADGVRIHGWWLPSADAAPLTVLFLHGNAGNISHRLEKLAVFRELRVNVFVLDYRGYGRSEGHPDEAGTYADARAGYDYLTKTRSMPAISVVVYGESLGSAVAVDLATKVPVGGVIIEEAFTSIADVGQKMFPLLPVRWLVRDKYDTLNKIGRINAPLLMFHSRQDELFSWQHAERLYAATREPKKLVELRGAHNDAFAVSSETYRAGLNDFFAGLKR